MTYFYAETDLNETEWYCKLIFFVRWSREKAESFMTENSFLSAAGITHEIDRYITWPGQVNCPIR